MSLGSLGFLHERDAGEEGDSAEAWISGLGWLLIRLVGYFCILTLPFHVLKFYVKATGAFEARWMVIRYMDWLFVWMVLSTAAAIICEVLLRKSRKKKAGK